MSTLSFAEPWHAQVFALTTALNEAGHFTWAEWTESFGAALVRHRGDEPIDGGEAYYAAWLEALEELLAHRGLVDPARAEATRAAWEAAYLATPHGQPVRLDQAGRTVFRSSRSGPKVP